MESTDKVSAKMFYIFDSEFDCPIAKTCLKSGDGEP